MHCHVQRQMTDLETLIQQLNLTRQAVTYSEPERKTVANRKLQDIAVAYVVHNADGSFTQLQMHRMEVKQVWTTVIAETEKARNSITDLRLAPLDQWEDEGQRKRSVYAQGVAVQPNECLCKCLKRKNIVNPVLLVVWEHLARIRNRKACCTRKTNWSIILFTNSTKCKGGPVILVHTASGTAQLDEQGVDTIASSAFIEWLENKVQTEKWEVISLDATAASVRVVGAQ